MPGTPFRLPPLSMIMLGVQNVDRSVAFYQNILGVEVRQRLLGFPDPDGHLLTLFGPERK